MSISVVDDRFIEYSVPAFSVLLYEYAYYGRYGDYHTSSGCIDGGDDGSEGRFIGAGAGCEITSESYIPYTEIDLTVTSSPAGIMTLTSSERGGYQNSCSSTYYSAIKHYSYDPSTWLRSSSGDVLNGANIDGDNWDSGSITIYSVYSSGWNSSCSAVIGFKKATGSVSLTNVGSGSVSGSGKYNVGESFTITADPSEGWHFVRWEDDTSTHSDPYNIDGSTSASITKTTLPRTQGEYGWYSVNAYYRAVFERNTYSCSINWDPDLSGDDRVSATASVYDPDTGVESSISFPVNGAFKFQARITVSFTANEDFWCDYGLRWSVNPSSHGFIVPVGGVSSIAYFTRKTYTVSIFCSDGGDSLGGYFTINGSGHYTSSVTLNDNHHGDTVTVVGYPNEGWTVRYGDNGNSSTINCGDGPYIFIYFERSTHNVSVTAPDGEGCVYSIDSTGGCYTSQTKQITHGISIYLLAKGENCHKFLRWTGVPSDKQDTNGVLVDVTSDMTIAAVFEECSSDGRLIHCHGDILFDPTSGMPWFQVCDCS